MKLMKNQILNMHKMLIAQTGGTDGIRDHNLLDSAVNGAFQTFDKIDIYPSLEEKAAKLAFSIIKNHPFIDGNKRIGLYVMLVFLELNGCELNYTQQELIDLGLGVADSSINDIMLLQWVQNHLPNKY